MVSPRQLVFDTPRAVRDDASTYELASLSSPLSAPGRSHAEIGPQIDVPRAATVVDGAHGHPQLTLVTPCGGRVLRLSFERDAFSHSAGAGVLGDGDAWDACVWPRAAWHGTRACGRGQHDVDGERESEHDAEGARARVRARAYHDARLREKKGACAAETDRNAVEDEGPIRTDWRA